MAKQKWQVRIEPGGATALQLVSSLIQTQNSARASRNPGLRMQNAFGVQKKCAPRDAL